ncbi:hypothetical protein [Pedobacter ginsengisoli]|uniref:hypothetical protein n=1 Tax=Pedobacter ginsengisoli TaxID=363852 RepID=UPI00254EE915|nr:hypothetical protein [Pedobacter ginsengisoli]
MSVIKVNQIGEETPLDRIYKAFIAHELDKLSASDSEIYTRITEIDRQMTARKPVKKQIRGKDYEYTVPYRYKELCEWIVERFKVSHRQAYIDIDMTKRFFANTETREDKEIGRGQRIAIGDELMWEAKATGDYKSAHAFFKEVNEISGYKRVDPETINPEHLVPSEFLIVNHPSELETPFPVIENFAEMVRELERDFKQKTVNKIMDDAVDIDYESDETAE